MEKETQDIGKSQFIETMKLMNGIVREMKEIAELPSEVATDQQNLTKVEFPADGGVLTYMGGHEFPYKGFPFNEFVERIDLIKKILRGNASGMYHRLKRRRYLTLLTLLPSLWLVKDFVSTQIYTNWRFIERFKLKPIRYSTPIRELHRCFSIARKESTLEQEMRFQLRDLICMLLEFDNAYRFRFQDIVYELNKENLKANPSKELLRLLKLMMSREKTQEIKDTWRLLELLVSLYLRFDRKMLKLIRDVLKELDLEKIKLDKGDEHWCKERKDYVFAHQTLWQSSTQVQAIPPLIKSAIR